MIAGSSAVCMEGDRKLKKKKIEEKSNCIHSNLCV